MRSKDIGQFAYRGFLDLCMVENIEEVDATVWLCGRNHESGPIDRHISDFVCMDDLLWDRKTLKIVRRLDFDAGVAFVADDLIMTGFDKKPHCVVLSAGDVPIVNYRLPPYRGVPKRIQLTFHGTVMGKSGWVVSFRI